MPPPGGFGGIGLGGVKTARSVSLVLSGRSFGTRLAGPRAGINFKQGVGPTAAGVGRKKETGAGDEEQKAAEKAGFEDDDVQQKCYADHEPYIPVGRSNVLYHSGRSF